MLEKKWNIVLGPSLFWPYEGAVFGCLHEDEEKVSLIELYGSGDKWFVRANENYQEQVSGDENIELDVITLFPSRDEAATFAANHALKLLA